MIDDVAGFQPLYGPLLTAMLIALHFALARLNPSLRSVTSLLLLAVAYSTYRGGLRSGAISGLLVFAYLAYDLSDKSFLEYTHVELERIGSLLLVTPGIVALVHSLRLRALYSLELERQVAERTADLAKLNARIAHDLRGALIQVLRYAELLETESAQGLPEPERRYVGRIRHNARQMDHLVDELLRTRR